MKKNSGRLLVALAMTFPLSGAFSFLNIDTHCRDGWPVSQQQGYKLKKEGDAYLWQKLWNSGCCKLDITPQEWLACPNAENNKLKEKSFQCLDLQQLKTMTTAAAPHAFDPTCCNGVCLLSLLLFLVIPVRGGCDSHVQAFPASLPYLAPNKPLMLVSML